MGSYQYIYNEGERLTAKQLHDCCSHQLPVLVVVATGFYSSREEMTFSTGQVLLLHELRQQQRALAHDETKKTLSIPFDYSQHFFVGKSQSEAFTLRQVLEKYSLPVDVRIVDPQLLSRGSLSKLQIIKTHNEIYFLANTIAQGRLLNEVLSIPLYLTEVTFYLVTGLRRQGVKDDPLQQLEQLLNSLSLAHVDFSRDYSDKEIVQLSAKPLKVTDDIYLNTETNIYINMRSGWQRPQLRPQNSDNNYSSSSSDYENPHSVNPPVRPPKPANLIERLAHNHKDDLENDNIYEPVNELHKFTSKMVTQQSHGNRMSDHCTPTVDVRLVSELTSVLQAQKKKVDKTKKLSRAKSEPADQKRDADNPPTKSLPTRPNVALKPSVCEPSDTLNPSSSTEKHKGLAGNCQVKPKPWPAAKPLPHKVVQQQAGRSPTTTPSKPKVATPILASDLSQAEPTEEIYVNQKGMAIVSPTPQPEKSSTTQELMPTLKEMTIEHVQQLLKRLNLTAYSNKFMSQLVDGMLLQDLDPDTLRVDFGMSRIETLRLRTFVEKGHIPK